MTDIAPMDLTGLRVGDHLPEHIQGPISRTTLALFAGASADHNPMHIDSDVAKAAGMDDVFAHGMLSMAYLAQLLTHWVPQERLVRWGVRFTAITPLHATVHATGKVIAIADEEGSRVAEIEIRTATGAGVVTLTGHAFVRID